MTPTDKNDRIQEILLREDLTAQQKCVGAGIVLAADKDRQAQLSLDALKRIGSIKDAATVCKATAALQRLGLASKTSVNGQAGRYAVPANVVAAVTEAYEELKTMRTEPQRSLEQPCGIDPRGQSLQPCGSNPNGLIEPLGLNPHGLGRSLVRAEDINTYPNQELTTPKVLITTVEQAERGLQGESVNPKRAAPRLKPTAAQFERFWDAYPLRKGKPKALEKFLALTPDQAERAIVAAHAYAVECVSETREARFIKWPQGWLSERRFDDDQVDPHEALRGPGGERWGWWRGKEGTLRALPVDRWRDAVKALKPNGTWPWWKLTAPPGHKECLMPAELVAEYGYEEIYKGQITHS